MTDRERLSSEIKKYAHHLGFSACGFCRAESIGCESEHLQSWLDKGYAGNMDYLHRNFEKRCDPTILVEGAKTVISVALNYYPAWKQSETAPQFAYYAYGKDYHDVMKEKLQQLFNYIETLVPSLSGRVFCDTAPVMERYWAAKAGIGFIGKNTLLIIPKMGSFFFLGELILDLELEYDKPLVVDCGRCTRCLDACPTNALKKPYLLDGSRCISYQTIENKGDIAPEIKPKLSNRVYGCDICQQVCPWNRYAKAHQIEEFKISDGLLNLTHESMAAMSVEDYQKIFKGSAVKRAKHSGLMRNIAALRDKE